MMLMMSSAHRLLPRPSGLEPMEGTQLFDSLLFKRCFSMVDIPSPFRNPEPDNESFWTQPHSPTCPGTQDSEGALNTWTYWSLVCFSPHPSPTPLATGVTTPLLAVLKELHGYRPVVFWCMIRKKTN